MGSARLFLEGQETGERGTEARPKQQQSRRIDAVQVDERLLDKFWTMRVTGASMRLTTDAAEMAGARRASEG